MDLGPISELLGMKVVHDRDAQTITLSQEPFVEAILAKYNFSDAKPISVPMDPSVQYSRDQCPTTAAQTTEMKHVPFRSALGSLMYLAVGMCPDIAFIVSMLAQFADNPGWAHWEGIKRIYRYLLGTKKLGLTFGTSKSGLIGYTDADGASQEHRRAITGFTFLVDGGAILWGSKKQELVTLSTAEAKYVAATHAAKKHFGFDDSLQTSSDLSNTPRHYIVTINQLSHSPKTELTMHARNTLISDITSFVSLSKATSSV